MPKWYTIISFGDFTARYIGRFAFLKVSNHIGRLARRLDWGQSLYNVLTFLFLLDMVEKILNDPSASSRMCQMAIRVLSIAADSWETHNYLKGFIPKLIHLVQTSRDNEIQRVAVMFLGKFAYNPTMRTTMTELGALPPLIQISNSPELRPVAATLAVANLANEDFVMSRASIEDLVVAFDNTLLHKPYPPGTTCYGTAWKIAMGFSNLCRNPINAQTCLKSGLLKVVINALESTDQRLLSSKLTEFCLLTLWRLARFESTFSQLIQI